MFTKPGKTKKEKEVHVTPVVKFDASGRSVLPFTRKTDKFLLFQGRTADDVKATNISIYFGNYEIPEGKKCPVAFKIQLIPVYGKDKAKVKTELPSMLSDDAEEEEEEEEVE